MSDVAAYRVFAIQSTYLPSLETTHTQIRDMLPHRL